MADEKDEKKVPEGPAKEPAKLSKAPRATAKTADKTTDKTAAAKPSAKPAAVKPVSDKKAVEPKAEKAVKAATAPAGAKAGRAADVEARPAAGSATKSAIKKASPKAGRKPTVRREPLEDALSVKVYSMKGEESGSLHLPEAIFGEKPNHAVMHQAIRRQLANARQGTASTKKRDDVSGGGRKPFRQKGLGRSRHGSEREPSMVGGGTVFGPQPRSFRLEMPRKMRRLALRSALSVKAADGQVSVIDSFSMEKPRTRTMVDLLESVGVEGTALVVLAAPNEVISRSTANLPWAKTILAHNLNLYDLFTHDHIVFAQDAVDLIAETFSR